MIQARHLVKRFGSFTAVHDVTFEVAPGQILALLGPNGAGKTTTIRMLASLLRPSGGSATIADFDTVEQPEQVRRSVGLLTELPGLYGRMGAEAYLAFFGGLYPIPEARRAANAEALLTYFGIWEHRARAIGSYSKGMRQKVALARALLHDPQVILLDEPTSAMDPASAKSVRDYIAGLRRAGRTILMCTHNLAEAETLADSIAIIKRGKVVAHGSPVDLKRQLLGDPQYEVRLAQPLGATPGLDGLATLEGYGDTWLRYRTPTPEATNPAVVQRLVDAGAQVVSLQPVGQTLEAVYLHMVEEQAA